MRFLGVFCHVGLKIVGANPGAISEKLLRKFLVDDAKNVSWV